LGQAGQARRSLCLHTSDAIAVELSERSSFHGRVGGVAWSSSFMRDNELMPHRGVAATLWKVRRARTRLQFNGADVLSGGPGQDSLNGGTGSDVLIQD
jgi:hypothetical protein